MTRVLVVCIGNMCRSPLAERLLDHRGAEAGLDWSVSSAGTRAVTGSAMHPHAADQLTRLGGSAQGFAARLLGPEHVEGADLVLVATKELRAEVLRLAPAAMRRTFTLLEFAALTRLEGGLDRGVDPVTLVRSAAAARPRVASQELDVPDPIGKSLEVHRQVADTIALAVDQVVAALGAVRSA